MATRRFDPPGRMFDQFDDFQSPRWNYKPRYWNELIVAESENHRTIAPADISFHRVIRDSFATI